MEVSTDRILEMIYQIGKRHEHELEVDPSEEELNSFQPYMERHDIQGDEYFFHPEENNYLDTLKKLSQDDVVFDIGAGDLRFDLLMSLKVKKVYAIEISPSILSYAFDVIKHDLPKKVIVICANGFTYPIPEDVTAITCLMIHREHELPKDKKYKIIAY